MWQKVIDVHKSDALNNAWVHIGICAEGNGRTVLRGFPFQKCLIQHREIVRAPHRQSDEGRQPVARLCVPNWATTIQGSLVHAVGHFWVLGVDPDPGQPWLAIDIPLRMQALDPTNHVCPPSRSGLPSPQQVVRVLQGSLQVAPCKHTDGPRHLHCLQHLSFLNCGTKHSTDPQASAREDLRPGLHQEDLDVALCHALDEAVADTSIIPIRASPEQHGLVDYHPTSRSSIFFDPSLHISSLKEVSCWIVWVNQAKHGGFLGLAGHFPPSILASPLVLAILHLHMWADAIRPFRRHATEEVDQLGCAVAKDEALFGRLGTSWTSQKSCRQVLKV
mmetsp:Transcript_84212/g.212362  ORF Transcript_84212/g.212362 Transcript_84212/m.212362 type:complete len:333 (+) Transcript_84212:790-1788(+)